MKRLLVALVAGAALAAPAQALPPLQPHAAPILAGLQGAPAAVVTRAQQAVIAAANRKGMFLLDRPSIAVGPIQACGRQTNPRPCIRPLLLRTPRGDPTVPIHVAVLVGQARPGVVRLICIGAGKAAKDAATQSVLVDLGRALSTDPKLHDKPLHDVSWCVFNAMNEYLL